MQWMLNQYNGHIFTANELHVVTTAAATSMPPPPAKRARVQWTYWTNYWVHHRVGGRGCYAGRPSVQYWN